MKFNGQCADSKSWYDDGQLDDEDDDNEEYEDDDQLEAQPRIYPLTGCVTRQCPSAATASETVS